MRGRLALLVALLFPGCASPTKPGEDDAGPPLSGDLAGVRRDLAVVGLDGAPRDAAPGADLALACGGKNLQTDPMNCGTCGRVCMAPNVAMNSCVAGQCRVGMCSLGFYDVNSMSMDGCECKKDDAETQASSQCAGAASLGTVSDAMPSMQSVSGNIVPLGDEDWYQIESADTADGDGACDKYKLRVEFTENPKQQFRFDVVFDDCMTQATCAGMNETPVGLTEYEFSANDGPDGGNQCPCYNSAKPPKGAHTCKDDSQKLRLRVYRLNGSPVTCDTYKLVVSNGM